MSSLPLFPLLRSKPVAIFHAHLLSTESYPGFANYTLWHLRLMTSPVANYEILSRGLGTSSSFAICQFSQPSLLTKVKVKSERLQRRKCLHFRPVQHGCHISYRVHWHWILQRIDVVRAWLVLLKGRLNHRWRRFDGQFGLHTCYILCMASARTFMMRSWKKEVAKI